MQIYLVLICMFNNPTLCTLTSGFCLRESMSEVKCVVDELTGLEDVPTEKIETLHKHYQLLVREYKRLERKLTEGQKKFVEVSSGVLTRKGEPLSLFSFSFV